MVKRGLSVSALTTTLNQRWGERVASGPRLRAARQHRARVRKALMTGLRAAVTEVLEEGHHGRQLVTTAAGLAP